MARFCFRCGGDADELEHWRRCDGQQGIVEALADDVNPFHNVRTSDPETSYRAAFSHLGLRASQRWRCYLAIIASRALGLTDDELAERTGIRLNSANKRRGELFQKHLVCDGGGRRRTAAGSLAIVWVASEYAHGRSNVA